MIEDSAAPLSRITAHGTAFRDAEGRQVILRGANLGGDCKVPFPDGGTHHPSDFSDHRTVSFIGRPFPLDAAPEHFARLRSWGFNCLRLLTTWEAVEHAGPGQYDTAYLDYFAEIVRLAGAGGLYVFIDFHQDAWSRMSGGDGAPGWTFEAVGLDFTRFARAGAAHVMQAAYDYASPLVRQPGYPQMSWPFNYRLPANAILWTLFWAGARVTPGFAIDGANVQHFLQGHYLGAISQVARRIRDFPHVLGFDTLNEPGTGWIGQRLTEAPRRPGPALAPLDGLAIARGLDVTVPVLAAGESGAPVPHGSRRFNADRVTTWRDGASCPFAAAGAYALHDGKLAPLDEEIFSRVSLIEDCVGPFFRDVARTIRAQQPDWLLFAEIEPSAASLGRGFPRDMPEAWVDASHWYDLDILVSKSFAPASADMGALGERYRRALGAYRQAGDARGVPALLGEFGLPFDLAEGASYAAWRSGRRDPGVWEAQAAALALMYDALDAHLLSATLWNYTASNRNDLRIGDGWNQEDLSIFSLDQKDGADDGGRAVTGFCRPYVARAQGRIVEMTFDRARRSFVATLEADPAIAAPTEIHVPEIQFPGDYRIECSDPDAQIVRRGRWLAISAAAPGPLRIAVAPA
jgi:hypothetical protein